MTEQKDKKNHKDEKPSSHWVTPGQAEGDLEDVEESLRRHEKADKKEAKK